MNKKWNEKTNTEKAACIISYIGLVVWVVFEILGRKGTVEYAELVSCSAICIVCICEGYSLWNVKRSLSYVAIGAAVCLIAVLVLQWILLS